MASEGDRWIEYGAKRMPLGSLTLEQAKEVMARHFPELSNPKVETKKEGEKTIYVFSKQAGHKGSLDRVRARLVRLKAAQPVPADVAGLLDGRPIEHDFQEKELELLEAAVAVIEAREHLSDLAPLAVPAGEVLL